MLHVQMVPDCIEVTDECLIRNHKELITLMKLIQKLGCRNLTWRWGMGARSHTLRSPFNKELAVQIQGTHFTDSLQWQIKVLGNGNSALIYHVVHNTQRRFPLFLFSIMWEHSEEVAPQHTTDLPEPWSWTPTVSRVVRNKCPLFKPLSLGYIFYSSLNWLWHLLSPVKGCTEWDS